MMANSVTVPVNTQRSGELPCRLIPIVWAQFLRQTARDVLSTGRVVVVLLIHTHVSKNCVDCLNLYIIAHVADTGGTDRWNNVDG